MASGSYLTSAQQTRNSRGDRILPRTASGNNNSSSSSRRMVHNPGGSQRSLSPINRRQITMGSSQQLQGSYRGMKRTQTAPVPPKTSHTGPPTAAAPTMRRNQTAPIHHTTATNTKPKPRRLLVDYSKKRANLTQGRQTQSERTLLPPRTKSLDQLPDNRGSFATAHSYHDRPNSDRNLVATASSATAGPNNIPRGALNRHNTTGTTSKAGPTNIPRGVLNRHNTTGMSRSQSAREVVDWHVLNSTLDWEKEEEKTRQSIASQHASSNTRRGRRRIQHQQPQQQESSSCSNLLRKSFLTKPLGTSSSHLQGTEFEFTPSFGGNNSYDDDNDQRGRQQHNHQTIAIARRASLSPKRKNVSPKLAEQRKKSIMISPQQRKNGLATSPALMDDESMRLGDVFGSSSRMDNSSSNDGNSRRRQQEPQEEEQPADDFFSRLDKEAQMPNHVQPLNQERLYRSMSALANTLVVPPKLVSLEQQQPRDSNVSVLSNASYLKDDSHDEDEDQQLQQQRNGSHNSNMDASVGDDVSVASVGSLSFRRTSGDKNKRNGSHHLKGSLAGLPSWDGDFDNSLSSSFSSHWEPMSDMSSVVSNNNNEMEKNHSRRSQQQQQSNNTPGSSPTKPRTLASSPTKQRNSGASPTTGNNKQRSSAASRKMRVSNKAAASTALGIKEDEDDDEEEDLLFLPKSMQPARSPLDDSSSNNKRGGRSRSSANSSSAKNEDVPDLLQQQQQEENDADDDASISVDEIHEEEKRASEPGPLPPPPASTNLRRYRTTGDDPLPSRQSANNLRRHHSGGGDRLNRSTTHLRRTRSNDEDKMNRSFTSDRNRNVFLNNGNDSNSSGEFNLRFAFRKQPSGVGLMNGSSNSISRCNSSDSSMGLDDEEMKKQRRDQLIKQNSSFKKHRKQASNRDLVNADLRDSTNSNASESSRARSGAKGRQLSCDMLGSEYDRFTKREQLKKAQSARSVSPTPRRNAALLAKMKSERQMQDQQQSAKTIKKASSSSKLMSMAMPGSKFKSMSSSNLMSSLRDAPKNMMDTMTNSIRDAPKNMMGSVTNWSRGTNQETTWSRNAGDRPGLVSQGSSRRDRFRRQMSPRRGELLGSAGLSSSFSPTRPAHKAKNPIGRSKSMDEDSRFGAGGFKPSLPGRGFRESMIRQSSFVTGSRIRRHNGGGGGLHKNHHKDGSSGFESGSDKSNLLHYSSPNLMSPF